MYKKNLENWLNSNVINEADKKAVISVKDNEELEDMFYKNLEFGTAGLRGIIGPGSNRMNIYTVGLATQAFSNVINSKDYTYAEKGMAIVYDVRHMSKEFAEIAARCFAANGIKVYLKKENGTTPFLSFLIRELKLAGGVMITASHNPKNYNGYKAYWEEGSQILEDLAGEIKEQVEKISFEEIKLIDLEEGFNKNIIQYLDGEIYKKYINDILNKKIENENIDKNIKIVYSPLNGTGSIPVREVLEKRGFNNLFYVEEELDPDPDFKTTNYPNPENQKVFKLSEKLGREEAADILIATDPDCDRAAIEVRDKNGDYIFLNGNKIGALLVNYILERLNAKKKLKGNEVVVKSIVTGDLTKYICEKYGIELVEVLTGFKNIAEVANKLDKTNDKIYLFGFEESIGYCYTGSVRDKDAVNSSMMIAEMAAYYKNNGLTLLDVLEKLYEEHGYFFEKLNQVVLEGINGREKIKEIMSKFRNKKIEKIGNMNLVKMIDYLNSDTGLAKSDVLKFLFDDGSWFAVRPSGTEPKIKFYIYSRDMDENKSKEKLLQIEKCINERLN